ncbi:enoyl-CoA hydratase/isomerase family protein [uncultured Hyphomonas sp.]|uniref:enoyl-CoA hydratase/isomerase family protein n=1 Tax=uncultured Hyphomonas sp. TaxID=225298 RepID=UPI002AAA7068|nr:enoyl-CoA hydratase/isomerase family protein [uncultured Hyphomonas sp.]
MDYQHLILEREGHILTCRMHNPPNQTLNTQMLYELHDMLSAVEQDDNLRVLVVTGTDDVFLRWMELTEMQSLAHGERQIDIPAVVNANHTLARRIEALPVVTIAAINGNVGGGGCEFSLSFDFRLMKDSPTATFALPQSSFGLVPGGSGGWYALKYLGRAKALDILLHGDFLQPSTALELGLISRLYSEEDFDSEVKAFAEKFAARAPLAMRGIKRLVNAGTNQDQLNFMAQEAKEIMQIIVSEDAQHALDMWLSNPDPEAYNPQFKGK